MSSRLAQEIENIGKDKGKNERNIEIAKNLKNLGISINQISIATGLTIQEIEKL